MPGILRGSAGPPCPLLAEGVCEPSDGPRISGGLLGDPAVATASMPPRGAGKCRACGGAAVLDDGLVPQVIRTDQTRRHLKSDIARLHSFLHLKIPGEESR